MLFHTSRVEDVNHCLGKCRVRCSSTTARRGENKRRACSIAAVLEGKMTTFLHKIAKDEVNIVIHYMDQTTVGHEFPIY